MATSGGTICHVLFFILNGLAKLGVHAVVAIASGFYFSDSEFKIADCPLSNFQPSDRLITIPDSIIITEDFIPEVSIIEPLTIPE